jgi:protein-tyrosine phosphatase
MTLASSEQAVKLLAKGAAFIGRAIALGGHVLVHCKHGHNRSSSVVCAYLMQQRQPLASVDESIAQLKALHPKASPAVFVQHGAAFRAALDAAATPRLK